MGYRGTTTLSAYAISSKAPFSLPWYSERLISYCRSFINQKLILAKRALQDQPCIADRTTPAFTALLTSDTSSTYIRFDDVIVNTNGDYDRLTGAFTCSVPGTYLFTWTAETNGAESRTRLVIQRSSGTPFNALDIVGEETKGDEYDSSTGVFIDKLYAGDIVKVMNVVGKIEGGYSSFSGWMLF